MKLDKLFEILNKFFKLMHKRKNVVFRFLLLTIITVSVIFVSSIDNKKVEADDTEVMQNDSIEDSELDFENDFNAKNENIDIKGNKEINSILNTQNEKEEKENFNGITISVKMFVFGKEGQEIDNDEIKPMLSLCEEYNYKVLEETVYLNPEDYNKTLIEEFKKENYDIAVIPYKDVFARLAKENLLAQIPGNMNLEYIEMNGEKVAVTANEYKASGLFYNKEIIEENGLKDPIDLYNEGSWTLEQFYDYVEKTTADIDEDGTNDIYGLVISEDLTEHLATSNNANIVNIEDGEVEFNVNDPNMIKVLTLINTIYENNYKGGLSKQGFIDNRACFYNDYAQTYTELDLLMEQEIGFVPYPSDYGITTSSASDIKLFVTNKSLADNEEKLRIIESMMNESVDIEDYYMNIFNDQELSKICLEITNNICINPIHKYSNLYTLYLDMLRDIKVGMGLDETIDKYDQSKDRILNAINN